MKVRFVSASDGRTKTGELQQWVYHPDVGVKAVILLPDGSFEMAGLAEVTKSDDR